MKILRRKSVIRLRLIRELGEVVLPMLPRWVRSVAAADLTAMHHAALPVTSLVVVGVTYQSAVCGTTCGALSRLAVLASAFVALVALLALLSLLSFSIENLVPLPT